MDRGRGTDSSNADGTLSGWGKPKLTLGSTDFDTEEVRPEWSKSCCRDMTFTNRKRTTSGRPVVRFVVSH